MTASTFTPEMRERTIALILKTRLETTVLVIAAASKDVAAIRDGIAAVTDDAMEWCDLAEMILAESDDAPPHKEMR